MLRYFTSIIFIFFISINASALSISAEGFGDTADSARSAAMAELSYTIFSSVSSSLSYSAESDYKTADQKISKQTNITTELPIIGAKMEVTKLSDGYTAKAVLDESSAKLYKAQLEDAVKQADALFEKYNRNKTGAQAYSSVLSLLVYLDNFEKLNSVYLALTGESHPKPSADRDDAQKALASLSDSFDSMKLCAKVMAKELNIKSAYIYYPATENSDEVTEFSNVFHGMLSAEIAASKDVFTAEKFVSTQYNVTKDGLYITSYLTDKNGKTISVSNKRLLPSAYKNLDVSPVSLSFEKLLKQGLSVSSDFKARITTKNGKKSVLYKDGDVLELFVKVNKPSYFYILGHVMKDKDKYSYLVELYNTEGGRRFVRYVDGDEINRWISLGEFEIVPPFGTEVFQMIASQQDPIEKLPVVSYDKNGEQYIISDNPEKNVAAVRAIKRKESVSDIMAEDVLIFSSIHR